MSKPRKVSGRHQQAAAQKGRNKRAFPATTVGKALVIAQKIKELNGGNPWSPQDIATAIEVGSKSPKFYYLTGASRDYGLTVGYSKTDKISIGEIGKEVLYAANPAAEQAAKIRAFRNIEIFSKVLDHYKGSTLPEMKYLGNTLEREFKLPSDEHEEFARVFRENCEELGIKSGVIAPGDADATADAAAHPTTMTIGEPAKGAKLKAFVIMPFVERVEGRPKGFFSEVLRSLITPAGVKAGFTVQTANRQGSDLIQSTIINDLLEADLVIADLTDHNPNVLFELGVRMAHDKPICIIKAAGTGRIFDIDNLLRVWEYSPNLWSTTIDKDTPELVEHIRATWDRRDADQTYMKILRSRTDK